MTKFTNSDDAEITKFDNVSQIWWDPKGEMGTLHTINPLRTKYIMDGITQPAPRMLDVGCGGGILSEALAEAGADVTGIDLSQLSLEVAAKHAQTRGIKVDYQYQSVEELAKAQPASFDAITCMEMMEHVPEPANIVAACAKLLKPGGHFFCSTINRTPKSLFAVIFVGEYILRLLPRGTHTYSKLIKPNELRKWAKDNGLEFVSIASLIYNPFNKTFKVAHGVEDMNYMAHFIKK